MDHGERLSVASQRRVRRVQGMRDLRADVRRQRFRHHHVLPARNLEDGPERRTVDEFQHEDGAVLLGLQVVERGDDAGVVQRSHHAGLVGEHRRNPWIAAALRSEHLEDDSPPERACSLQLREPDFAHAPETQSLLEDVPGADAFACLHTTLWRSLTGPCPYLL